MADELKSFEGSKSTLFSEQVTEDRIRKFAQAVGSKKPFSQVAPPTFMTIFRKGEFELFANLGLKLENVLHAEQLYVYNDEIRAGDHIQFQTTLSHVLEKKGGSGRLCFLTLETDVRTEDRPIGSSKTTIVVREKASA